MKVQFLRPCVDCCYGAASLSLISPCALQVNDGRLKLTVLEVIHDPEVMTRV